MCVTICLYIRKTRLLSENANLLEENKSIEEKKKIRAYNKDPSNGQMREVEKVTVGRSLFKLRTTFVSKRRLLHNTPLRHQVCLLPLNHGVKKKKGGGGRNAVSILR